MAKEDASIPLKQIIDRRYYEDKNAPHGTESVELTLECRHKVRRKKSAEPRHQVRCEQCYYDQTFA